MRPASPVKTIQSTKSYTSKPIVSNQVPRQEPKTQEVESKVSNIQKSPVIAKNAEKQPSPAVKQMSPAKDVVNKDLLQQKLALKPTTINKSSKPAEKPQKSKEKIDSSVRVMHEATEQYEFSIRSVRKTPTPKPAESPKPIKTPVKSQSRSSYSKPKPKAEVTTKPKVALVIKKQEPQVKNSWGFLGSFFGTQNKKSPSKALQSNKTSKPSADKKSSATSKR